MTRLTVASLVAAFWLAEEAACWELLPVHPVSAKAAAIATEADLSRARWPALRGDKMHSPME